MKKVKKKSSVFWCLSDIYSETVETGKERNGIWMRRMNEHENELFFALDLFFLMWKTIMKERKESDLDELK